jgi:hypothetical protein
VSPDLLLHHHRRLAAQHVHFHGRHLWFGAIGCAQSFKVSLLVVFPDAKPFKEHQLMVAPTRQEKPQAYQGQKIVLVPKSHDWLYWEIPEPEAGHMYSLHWTW